jgi:general secretion pathway protein F
MKAMPNYHYRAVTLDGVHDEGEMIEASSDAVIRRLQDSGRIPILAEEVVSGGLTQNRFKSISLKRKSARPDITGFTRSLALLLASGTALDRALEIMLVVEENPVSRKLVQDVQTSVRGGAALSAALEKQGSIFSGFYLSMIRAGELSGTLSETLERMLEYLERSRALRGTIVSALIYPAILLLVAGLSVIILLTLVVPQFRPIFEDMGAALPLATRFVLMVSDFFASFWWLALLTIAASCVVAIRVLSIPEKRHKLDTLMLGLPLMGPLICAHETARFSRSLGTLLHSGVPVLQSLEIARDTLSNRAMVAAVAKAAISLKEGGELSSILMQAAVFPGLAIQMINVGEETGNLDTMMLRIADVYDDEMAIKVRRVLAMMEPLLIVGLGVIIAGIIMSILVGIISINELPI